MENTYGINIESEDGNSFKTTIMGSKTQNHKFIRCHDSIETKRIRDVTFDILDLLLPNLQSRQAWKRDKKKYRVPWNDSEGHSFFSKGINYHMLVAHLRKHEVFRTEDFDLPQIECYWFDKDLHYAFNQHKSDHTGTFTIADGTPNKQYGKKYDVKPQLDREGQIFTSFQSHLISRIVLNRSSLIKSSDRSLEPEWFFQLRDVINDSISLVEITLNQIYIKAKYDPLENWEFDIGDLGENYQTRFKDKLKWVKKITGNNLNIESEREALFELKEVRNHLNHFDPPSFVVTLEEATIWLNHIIKVGTVLSKIRKALKVPFTVGILELKLLKEAVFFPISTENKRKPLVSKESGYYSSVWPQKQ